MNERPILFSAPMIRAILAGTKTVTRRIVKPQPPHSCRYEINGAQSHALCFANEVGGDGRLTCVPPTARSKDHRLPCPYGAPGDKLWVRETWGWRGSSWCNQTPNEIEQHIEYLADGSRRDFVRSHDPGHQGGDGLPRQVCRCPDGLDEHERRFRHGQELDRFWKSWRPSLFMPRWASRLTLEVVSVRVERLQSITEEDAASEGVTPSLVWGDMGAGRYSARAAFEALWDRINGDRAAWSSNCWVWVVSFRRVD